MKSVKLSQITLFNELAMRVNANYARLETWRYWPETIFEMDKHAWPADWEGRTMLALTMHGQSTGRTPAFLDEILDMTLSQLNEKGYMGPVYPDGVTHEQAMAGHSWMLRALVEYIYWKRETEPARAAKAREILDSIIQGLYLPQTQNYTRYPIDLATRNDDPNWILSHKQSKTKTHSGTSDCGCAFIAIDGATAALELTGNQDLEPLIENMIESYAKLPREALHVQTHATLSGIRGILRYYRLKGEQKHLDLVIKIFDLYKTKAWTDHYANYNWFGLPRWTEPCAVVDSLMISQELWEITREEGYLRDAHHILYNAIGHAQRTNGAFGTDQCCGAKIKPPTDMDSEDAEESEEAIIFARAQTYEVFWCCNMRGGDCLSRAATYTFYTEDNTVYVPHFHSCRADLELAGGRLRLEEKTRYPYEGKVAFRCLENQAGEVTLKIFAPEEWSGAAESQVTVNGAPVDSTWKDGFVSISSDLKEGDEIIFDTNMRFRAVNGNCCVNNSKEHFSFRHGPLMLGVHSVLENESADPTEVSIAADATMKPVGSARYETTDNEGKSRLLQPMWGKENLIEPLDVFQVLFKKD